MIKKLRVDYRLVHGQVAISWSRALGVDCILVANDEVAKDEMRQSMLRISKPQGIKLLKAASLGLPAENVMASLAVMAVITVVCGGISIRFFKWE